MTDKLTEDITNALLSDAYNELQIGDAIDQRNVFDENKFKSKEHSDGQDSYIPIKTPSLENIIAYLNDSLPSEPYPVDNQIGIFRSAPDNIRHFIEEAFVMNADIGKLVSSNRLDVILYIKAIFHERIVHGHMHYLIPRYNAIFNDGLYNGLQNGGRDVAIYPVTPDETLLATYIKEYQTEVHDIEARKRINAKPPKYEVGEIVGAQDKEGRWWLSQVLKIYSYLGQHMYYVEFLGWGTQFNEFIVSPFKIQRFNPKKHKYYRPAWSKKDLSDVPDESVEVNDTPKKEIVESKTEIFKAHMYKEITDNTTSPHTTDTILPKNSTDPVRADNLDNHPECIGPGDADHDTVMTISYVS
jgi:hypothetical protein